MTHSDLLSKTEIFGKLSSEELEAVARCVQTRETGAGEVLIREGHPGEALYLLRSGRVAVEKTLAGRTTRLAELGDGAVFGEMALIDNFLTSATVTTLAPSTLLVVGRLDLNVLLTWDTVLASKMWRSFTEMLCYRLRATNEKLLERVEDSENSEHKHLLATTSDIERH